MKSTMRWTEEPSKTMTVGNRLSAMMEKRGSEGK